MSLFPLPILCTNPPSSGPLDASCADSIHYSIASSKSTPLTGAYRPAYYHPDLDHYFPRGPNSREKSTTLCQYGPCRLPVNFIHGKHGCPLCRRLFCHFHWRRRSPHEDFQMKLGVDNLYDPVFGTFKTVCFACFITRD
jgi:hypothetical protein